MSSPTRYVVASIIGLAMLAAVYSSLGFHWGIAVAAALFYEGWTLVNRWPRDTISEAIWHLSTRPMIPFVFGVGSGWALAVNALPNSFAVAAWFFLMGHFFFQKHDADMTHAMDTAVDAVRSGGAVAAQTIANAAEAAAPEAHS